LFPCGNQGVTEAHAKSEEDTFLPCRDKDGLNNALESKEHPGHTRGYGNRPWKHALKSIFDRYAKKRKYDESFE
jgi:hypothetical protein